MQLFRRRENPNSKPLFGLMTICSGVMWIKDV